ncbi:uncharacterized protein LACBIDRAFT_303756 [Laccaria bicolor S238N-H82]|uniref:Predicted protein n=1 Tax=Laccaria bicolor (strain S238N-H82 / ATCC MYA-4686) TaxID=486041 RepID=B0DK89_LACBS|nr:uncharacterized protein LACBIDRAFT_303756 [Laccaria bicolor S238N-H82]EDR04899.1 predicted protein [Laccaria bicolor S238N-H82]|eukprot:XP_001884289.1 predicted protein [Laccaria bicolor S238N-H82]
MDISDLTTSLTCSRQTMVVEGNTEVKLSWRHGETMSGLVPRILDHRALAAWIGARKDHISPPGLYSNALQ